MYIIYFNINVNMANDSSLLQAVPFFVFLQVLEITWHTVKGRTNRLPRLNDALSSMLAGLMSLLPL